MKERKKQFSFTLISEESYVNNDSNRLLLYITSLPNHAYAVINTQELRNKN